MILLHEHCFPTGIEIDLLTVTRQFRTASTMGSGETQLVSVRCTIELRCQLWTFESDLLPANEEIDRTTR
jgi:hypothetical protein